MYVYIYTDTYIYILQSYLQHVFALEQCFRDFDEGFSEYVLDFIYPDGVLFTKAVQLKLKLCFSIYQTIKNDSYSPQVMISVFWTLVKDFVDACNCFGGRSCRLN